MGSEKLTITLPEDLVRKVRRVVRKRGGTVSGYVAHAVASYETREGLRALLDDLDAEFGLPTAEDRRWAERVMAGHPDVLYRSGGSRKRTKRAGGRE
jgi:Arc/MetJ-type ribon-helix-helix transcriptional regulator